jgi:2-oxoglutarate dehydrogenase E1 component
VREGYLEHLLALGEITQGEADDIAVKQREVLEKDLSEAQSTPAPAAERKGIWAGYEGGPERLAQEVDTGVASDKLKALLQAQCRLPESFTPHPKIKKFLEGRELMAAGERGLDWAAAEALAFATLTCEGVRVRLSGQDSQRGTFSQRHSVLHDYQNGTTYTPLQNLPGQTAPFEVFNSPLSEAGVLGFDYGYSIDYPTALVLWEAQYGDFWNGAQPIVDQFIVSAEDKWQRLSGLVLLLPHGLEGAGPEHSSARIERFLQLAADDNIQVVYPTTPAQYFHCLRRQMLRRWRKPLIVMTPKSLLRDPRALSSLESLGAKRFEKVLNDTVDPAKARRLLVCTGKIYYDLAAHREQKKVTDTAILRLEQVYPFPAVELEARLKGCQLESATWVQEEPANMGVWPYLRQQFGEKLLERFQLKLISRPASATPAAGSNRRHKQEQTDIMERAFAET